MSSRPALVIDQSRHQINWQRRHHRKRDWDTTHDAAIGSMIGCTTPSPCTRGRPGKQPTNYTQTTLAAVHSGLAARHSSRDCVGKVGRLALHKPGRLVSRSRSSLLAAIRRRLRAPPSDPFKRCRSPPPPPAASALVPSLQYAQCVHYSYIWATSTPPQAKAGKFGPCMAEIKKVNENLKSADLSVKANLLTTKSHTKP